MGDCLHSHYNLDICILQFDNQLEKLCTVLCKLVGTLKLYKHPTVITACYTVVIVVVYEDNRVFL